MNDGDYTKDPHPLIIIDIKKKALKPKIMSFEGHSPMYQMSFAYASGDPKIILLSSLI